MSESAEKAISIWKRCLEGIAHQVDADDLATWLAPLAPCFVEEHYVLLAPNAFVQDEVRRNYIALLTPFLPAGFRIRVGARRDLEPPASPPAAPARTPAPVKSETAEKPRPRKMPTENPVQGSLPVWWPDSHIALPNTWFRSAMFTVNVYGDDAPRPRRQRQKVASQQDLHVYVTGDELNQFDRDVMATLLDYQKQHSVATGFRFSARQVLSDLGLAGNGANVSRLRAALTRLRRTAVEISIYRPTGATAHYAEVNLLDEFVIDEREGRGGKSWYVRISPRVAAQFEAGAYTRLELETTRKLRSQLSKWLVGYWGSHTLPYPVTVAFLHRLSGSSVKELRNFKTGLKAALAELVSVGFLIDWQLDGDLVRVRKAAQGTLPHH